MHYALTMRGEILHEDTGAAGLLAQVEEGTGQRDGWTVAVHPVGESGLELYSFVPEGQLSLSAETTTRLITTTCLFAAGIVFVVSYIVAQTFSSRINQVCRAMERLQEGRFDQHLEVRTYDEIGFLMSAYNRMCDRIHALIDDLSAANREKNQADMRALQAQINPHFLYNSLTTVIRLAEVGRVDDVKAVVHALVRFYRMSLNQSGGLILLAEEIEHVREYLKICEIRFGEYAEAEMNVDEQVLEYMILPITIQPFVENVFKHAMRDDGRITHVEVNVYDAESEIHIFVVDDGVGMDEELRGTLLQKNAESAGKGYGVSNVNDRIKLYFGEKYGVSLHAGSEGGTVIKITIPKVHKEENT